jgi:hypothetical protein
VVKKKQHNNPKAALAEPYFASKWDESMWRRVVRLLDRLSAPSPRVILERDGPAAVWRQPFRAPKYHAATWRHGRRALK